MPHYHALIGLFNIFGSYYAGKLGGALPKRYLLSTIYLSRAVVISLFLIAPLTSWSICRSMKEQLCAHSPPWHKYHVATNQHSLLVVALAAMLAIAFIGYLQLPFIVDLANRFILCF